MKFLVCEQDLLVRSDICETISSAFDAVISEVSSLAEFGAVPDAAINDATIVVSVAGGDDIEQAFDRVSQRPGKGAVIIANRKPATLDPRLCIEHLGRPFSSDNLVSALRSVLSSRQSSRP